MTKRLTYVEIDIDYCANTYGVAPCMAALGVTGSIKCFNSIKTCQDRANFVNQPVTIRFAYPTDGLPRGTDAIPSIKEVSFTPAVVSLGKDIGQRSTLEVTFNDHPFSDAGAGFDKYVLERGYDPYKNGSFWGKFRARQPFLRGRPIRLINGEIGQALPDMEIRHYVIDSFDGPDFNGNYKIIAKDILKLADGDRSQAPRPNTGFLSANITASATSATLLPVGIGNAEYATSGFVAIGGNEICAFTRTGDVLNLTRGQLGTQASSHSQEDRVQTCLVYTGVDPADIIADLLQNYASIPVSAIPLADWKNETNLFLARLYTATIPQPTSVATLVSELIEQAGLVIWWNDSERTIGLRVLRGILPSSDVFSEKNIREGSLKITDQQETRLSRVQTFYGQIDPTKQLTETSNYRSMAETANTQSEADYGSSSIKVIYSRWIAAFGRATALRVNNLYLSRFRDPPRRFDWSILRGENTSVGLAMGYFISCWPLQDETGTRITVPVQVTQINPKPDLLEIRAEEVIFNNADDITQRVISIDADVFNINLRAVYNQIFPPPQVGFPVICKINSGVIVGSMSTAMPAFDIGNWPAGIQISLIVDGRIQGAGGPGGSGASTSGNRVPGAGGNGGDALKSDVSIILSGAGEIWSGAGGGGGTYGRGATGGGPGGGGQGKNPGTAGIPGISIISDGTAGQSGTPESGGVGGFEAAGVAGTFRGGRGGDAGQNGQAGEGDGDFPGAPGGLAGRAIVGVSLITMSGSLDIRGAQVG